MTITIGTWIIPLIVTIVAFFYFSSDNFTGGGSDEYGIGGFIVLCFTLIVSLVAWLIWALLT